LSTHQIKLIVGLGNPGPEYEKTRHNVGAWLVDQIAHQSNENLKPEAKFFGAIAKTNHFSSPLFLLKPGTYMNESGKSITAVANFYKIPVESILIAHDELDFEPGTIRLKNKGGHGGHNGLRSTISHLHTNDFLRLRIGIGHPGNKDKVTPYVLSRPNIHDTQRITTSIDDGISIIELLVNGKIEQACHQLHSDN